MTAGLDEVDAFLAGKTEGYKVTLPEEIDVKGIRTKLKMTQARFSDTFGFSAQKGLAGHSSNFPNRKSALSSDGSKMHRVATHSKVLSRK
jgi:hypothetical protein